VERYSNEAFPRLVGETAQTQSAFLVFVLPQRGLEEHRVRHDQEGGGWGSIAEDH